MLGAVALFALLFGSERLLPLRNSTHSLVGRLLVNIAISILTFVAAAFLVQPAAQWALSWSGEKPVGLVHLVALPVWLELALSFLLMDLAFYYWHVANHRAPFLWRFHNVHHADPDLDVSTAFRFHFGEVALSSLFTLIQVSVIGPSVWAFAVYSAAFQAEVLFHHSNLRLPIGFERLLNKVLVTPRMHGIHHSIIHDETDSNWSSGLTLWDWLHGTLKLNIPQDEITIGVAAYREPRQVTFPKMMKMPFEPHLPETWRLPGDGVPQRRQLPVANSHQLQP